MSLSLKIENVDRLPDGGPISFAVDQKGLDIGRDPFMDWTLPDPQRFISGTHCHIRYNDGGYWLHDVSTNGTMINGSPSRLTEPYRLQNGDRIHIGGYIVAVALAGDAQPGTGAAASNSAPDPQDPWAVQNEAPPVDQRQFRRDSGGGGSKPVSASFPDENIGFDAGFAGTPGPAASAGQSGSPQGLDFGVSARSAPAENPVSRPSAVPSGAAPEAAPTTDWRTGDPAPSGPDGGPQSEPEPGDTVDWRQAVGQEQPSAASTGEFDAPPPGAFETSPSSPSVTSRSDPAPATSAPANGFDASPAVVPDAAPPAPVQPDATQGPFDAGYTQEQPLPDWRAEMSAPAETLAAATAQEDQPDEEPLQLINPISVPARKEPPASVSSAPDTATAAGSFIAAFERGAGLPPGTVSGRVDEQFAEEIGQLFRLASEGVTVLLRARSETKTAMRSDDVTQFSREDNNPLKFSPTVEQAMKIMFGETPDGYLGARETMERSFADLQEHQLLTFSAMQQALIEWMNDLDPDAIAGDTSQDGGLAGLVNSRRAKLWDIYVERYRTKATHQQRGMIDAFMLLFSSKYSEQARAANQPGQTSGGS